MAISEQKEKSPYHGILIACIVLALVPLVLYGIVRVAIFQYQTQFSDELNEASSKLFGFGTGMLFHLSCIIAGALKEPFAIVVNRVKDFFSNLKFSFKVAWTCYKFDIQSNGVAFWIIFAVMIANVCLFIDGLATIIELQL